MGLHTVQLALNYHLSVEQDGHITAYGTIGVLPAAGRAVRMSGLPKFLLPSTPSGTPLLAVHAQAMSESVRRVSIVTRPIYADLVHSLDLPSNTTVITADTATMSESVLVALEVHHDRVILGMPDTDIFEDLNPYALLAATDDVAPGWGVAVWHTKPWQSGRLGSTLLDGSSVKTVADKDPERDYGWHWGALSWSCDQDKTILAEDPHVGYALARAIDSGSRGHALRVEGTYWDLGTPSEYARYLLRSES